MWGMIEGDLNKVSGRTAFAAAKKGDAVGLQIVEEYIYYLGVGITNMVNIFQPEVLSIGGGICGEGDYLLNPIKEIVAKGQYAKNTTAACEIKIAKLGNDAGIVGAVALGRQK
jgi:glucokinase